MEYNKGDKIKIKTWEEMEREYGIGEHGYIKLPKGYLIPITPRMDWDLRKNFPDRIVTIDYVKKHKSIIKDFYQMKKIKYQYWQDYMIECLVEAPPVPIPIPITSRYEILDIRD